MSLTTLLTTLIADLTPTGVGLTSLAGIGVLVAKSFIKDASKDLYGWVKSKVIRSKAQSAVPAVPAQALLPVLTQAPSTVNDSEPVSVLSEDLKMALDVFRNPQRMLSVSGITAFEITEAVANVPPGQRDAVGNTYVGLSIHWVGWLASLSSVDDTDQVLVILAGKNGARPYASCTVALSQFPELGVAPEGTQITVRGAIAAVRAGHVVLENVDLAVEGLSAQQHQAGI